MKYIIEIKDDEEQKYVNPISRELMIPKGFGKHEWEGSVNTGIMLTPYKESDTADQAWEIAQKILKDPSKDGMLNTELNNCFGTDDIYLIGEMSYAEVSKKYETWKKSKDEIKIGDEIAFYHDDGRLDTVAIVTHVSQVFVDGMEAKGTLYANKNSKNWTKTGRTFPEVVELLEKIGNQNIDK